MLIIKLAALAVFFTLFLVALRGFIHHAKHDTLDASIGIFGIAFIIATGAVSVAISQTLF